MKIIRTLTLTALLAGAFTTLQAKAPKGAQKQDKVEAYLKAHDTNKDGYIEKSEFPGSAAEFAKWDTNHDGKLDRGELNAMLNPPKTK